MTGPLRRPSETNSGKYHVERRTVMVAARVTPAEHAAWQDKAAAGLSPSALLRQAMARTRTWTAPALAIERERSRQIARIGNNLNQLARWANTTESPVVDEASNQAGFHPTRTPRKPEIVDPGRSYGP